MHTRHTDIHRHTQTYAQGMHIWHRQDAWRHIPFIQTYTDIHRHTQTYIEGMHTWHTRVCVPPSRMPNAWARRVDIHRREAIHSWYICVCPPPSRVQNAARDAAPALRGASGRDYETRKGGGGGGVPRWRRRRQRQRHKRKVVGWVTRKLREKEEGT